MQLQLNDGKVYIENNGYVGIGIIPTQKLEVYGDINSIVALRITNSNAGTSARSRLLLADEGGDKAIFNWNNNDNSAGIGTLTNRPFNLYQNDLTRVTIDSGGLVGFGLAIPTSRIHLDSGTATASYIQFTANATTGQNTTDGLKIGITSTADVEILNQEDTKITEYRNNKQVRIIPKDKSLTNNVSANIIDINCASNTSQSIILNYVIEAIDTGANIVRVHSGYLSVVVRNQGGTVTSSFVHPAQLENDLSTITDTFALTDGTGKATLALTANASAMTPTSMTLRMEMTVYGSNSVTML